MFKRFYDFGGASNIEHCINFCTVEGYVYAGVQYHTQCFCGNMFPKDPPYTKLTENECDKPCRGNPSQMCGGLWANKVYETGIESKVELFKVNKRYLFESLICSFCNQTRWNTS